MGDAMTRQVDTTPYPWLDLAREALEAASHADTSESSERAGRLVERIAQEHGADVIPMVMIAWIDTMLCEVGAIRVEPDGHAPFLDRPLRLGFVTTESGRRTTNSDDLTPEYAWAARLINCRATGDRDTYEALLDVPQDDEAWSRGVAALLAVCGLTIAHQGGR